MIESYLGDLIDLEGWSEFNGTFTLDTLCYAKFENRGLGASKKGIVKWLVTMSSLMQLKFKTL
ncbi:hypothetical protein CUMW_108260 [Citrus unshiu]|uniref:Pectinesterase catalytic domain-containing protein n=1 Tax=Citrus unshiu TaxID=55188 RepID=A0A2H5P6D7_CITUN|nr:hypothetical protein CUMW_108260 [Citrus unshiu]